MAARCTSLLLLSLCCLLGYTRAFVNGLISRTPVVAKSMRQPLRVLPLREGGAGVRLQMEAATARFSSMRAGPTTDTITSKPAESRTYVDPGFAKNLYEKAKKLKQTRQNNAALAAFERLTVLTPADGRVWMQAMAIHKRAGRYKDAYDVLQRGIAQCPDNALLRQALADVCRELYRWREARGHFRSSLRLDPKLRSAYDSWGRMEAGLGNHVEAEILFRRGLQIERTSRTYHALGVLQDSKLNRPDEARETLKKGLALPDKADNPLLLHALGLLEERARNYVEAREYFNKIIELHPHFTMAHLALGKMEESLGLYEAATRAYQLGASTPQPDGEPTPVPLWQSWARMERNRLRPDLGYRILRRAAQSHPTNANILRQLAKTAVELGDTLEARSIFNRLLALQPAPPAAAFKDAATFEIREGDLERARKIFSRGVTTLLPMLREGDNAFAVTLVPLLHTWAVFEWQQGDGAAARALFRKAEQLSPTPCAWVFLWRAKFEAHAGNFPLARHYFSRCVNADPNDPYSWRLWSHLEEEHGFHDRAKIYAARAVRVQALETLRSSNVDVLSKVPDEAWGEQGEAAPPAAPLVEAMPSLRDYGGAVEYQESEFDEKLYDDDYS